MKNKRRKSLSGVVLVMVMIVMFVLVIMLMATLAVVQTAERRINTKYEENQAYYTARSALDVFTVNMLKDGDYKAYDSTGIKDYNYGDGDTADMYQGLALELDLYSIEVQDDSGAPVDGANIYASALNTYAAANAGYDQYKNQSGTSENYFGVKDSGAPTEITYEITNFPVVSGTNAGAGKMLDSTGSGSSTVYTNAKITVKVLERDYNVDDSMWGAGTSYTTKEDLINSTDGAEAFAKGSRKKDTMKVKITATVEYMDYEGVAIVILDTHELPVNNGSRAITTFGGAGSDNMSIIGGASMADDVDWNNQGFMYGNIYSEKGFSVGTGPDVRLTDGESFYIGGDLEMTNNNFTVQGYALSGDADSKPFIYVEGIFKTQNATSSFTDVDMVCHGIQHQMNDFGWSGGNIYCVGDCDLTVANNLALNGDLYVQGDFYVSEWSNGVKYTSEADGIHIRINNGANTGNIYLNGNIVSKQTGLPLTGTLIYNGLTIQSLTDTISLPTEDDVKDPTTGNKTIEIDLPGTTGTVTKTLPTHVDNFNHYYQTDDTGALVIDPGTGKPIPISAQVQSGKMTDATQPLTADNLGITATLSSLGAPVTNPDGTTSPSTTFYNQTVTTGGAGGVTTYSELDTKGGTVSCIYDYTGSDNPTGSKVHIKGGGTVEMFVTGSGNDVIFVVDDDTTLIIYGDTSTSDINFSDKFQVFTETTAKAKSGAETLQVGSETGYGIKVPKIQYFISGNGNFKVTDNAFLTGYYYGPDTTLTLSAASNSIGDIDYNGKNIGGKNVAIVGSLLCNEAKIPNQSGVAYINPSLTDDSDPGKPIHNWDAAQYTRN